MEESQKYNRLTPIRFLRKKPFPSGKSGNLWLWKCDCGKETEALLNNVKRGHTQSCGCYQAQRRSESHTTHGHCKGEKPSRLMNIYQGMIIRCTNPSCKSYKYYGGRGIKVEWRTFEEFLADMGSTYAEGLSIDRINGNGNYNKENCRWATIREQSLNTSRNVILEFQGKKQSILEWSEELGIPYSRLQSRSKKGWSAEKVLSFPKREATIYTVAGKSLSLEEWSKCTGIRFGTLWSRIKRGWSIEKALTFNVNEAKNHE